MRQAVLVALALGAASLVGAQQPIILVPGTQVRAPTSPPADGFGRAVGGRGGDQAFGFGAGLVVGAPFARGAGGLRSGRVYDYVDPVDVDEVTIIDSPAPAAEGRFGAAVAGVNFETLVVGAPGENGGAGALYRALNPVTPPPFDPVVTPFTAHSPTAGESFGAALAAASGRVLAGAPGFGASGLAGAAYLLDPFNLDAPPVECAVPLPRPAPSLAPRSPSRATASMRWWAHPSRALPERRWVRRTCSTPPRAASSARSRTPGVA